LYLGLKTGPLVRAVAEGLVLGGAAPAESQNLPAGQVELLPHCIADYEIPLDPERSIVVARNFHIAHVFILR